MTEPQTSADVVRIERTIPAPPERVFEAWLDPATIAGWLSPTGRARAEVDASVGGRFRVVMLGDPGDPVAGDGLVHTGEYLEIDRFRRLVFTWVSPYTGPEPSRVTVDFEEAGSATRVVLLHEQLPADAVASHRGGWGAILDNLVRLLSEA